MKTVLPLAGFFVVSSLGLAQAGSVFTLGNGPETDGTLTLSSTAIHVDGSSSDINLTDVLEADFGDAPFQLNYFSSVDSPKQLPVDFKGQDIGNPSRPGSFTYDNGILTLVGSGCNLQGKEDKDKYFVLGHMVSGDSQVTVRLKNVEHRPPPAASLTQAGPMIRESLDPFSPHFAMGVSADGGGLFRNRDGNTGHAGWTNFVSDPPPIWLRLSRSGPSIDASISSDGSKWEIIFQTALKLPVSAWMGLSIDTFAESDTGHADLDQVTFSPAPAESISLPPGVLLRSGSFISGEYSSDAKSGLLARGKFQVALTPDQIAAVIIHPVTLAQIADVASQTGIILKNGDFLATDIQSVQGSSVTINSTLLGLNSYYGDSVRAVVYQPVEPQPSDLEVRLRDGSIIRAKSLDVSGDQTVSAEVSGCTVLAGNDEVAQVRAGQTRVQPLIELPWKSSTLPPAPAPSVETWTGPNQEQIISIPAGTSVNFPLSGKFSSLAARVALAPGSAANAQVIVRILADGREIARTPAFKAGDQPRFVGLGLQSPKLLTIVTDSTVSGTKTLFLDPVAIRE
ncbi:MAG: NPCBM/NEW2 domain-containing protein [Methylacidiphilales bacterium]|nr:NPCBM/NEW2 domain-containing protein [Candidatus Methylacidiphilales bacterium]